MKTMTCKQLGGACDEKFRAETFEEIGAMSKEHGMKMIQAEDPAHLEAMNKMREMKPEEFPQWFAARKAEFDALPEE